MVLEDSGHRFAGGGQVAAPSSPFHLPSLGSAAGAGQFDRCSTPGRLGTPLSRRLRSRIVDAGAPSARSWDQRIRRTPGGLEGALPATTGRIPGVPGDVPHPQLQPGAQRSSQRTRERSSAELRAGCDRCPRRATLPDVPRGRGSPAPIGRACCGAAAQSAGSAIRREVGRGNLISTGAGYHGVEMDSGWMLRARALRGPLFAAACLAIAAISGGRAEAGEASSHVATQPYSSSATGGGSSGIRRRVPNQQSRGNPSSTPPP